MEKMTECEIVQDLLFGYADNVLNKESKNLVERHLLECENCRKKLNEIKKDTNEHENNIKKEIDYLKKVRLKSRIKSILWLILIIATAFICFYLYKFTIINNISGKVSKQFKGENFYVKTISNAGFEEDGLFVTELWYKDGKFRREIYLQNEDGEITLELNNLYGKIGEKEQCEINNQYKTFTKTILPAEISKENLIPVYNPIVLSSQDHSLFLKLGSAFYTKISTDTKEIGRKYYVFELGEEKIWVDIDTGLPIMSFGSVVSIDYYKNTKIAKRRVEGIAQFEYSFDTVNDSDVEIPNVPQDYEVKTVNNLQ